MCVFLRTPLRCSSAPVQTVSVMLRAGLGGGGGWAGAGVVGFRWGGWVVDFKLYLWMSVLCSEVKSLAGAAHLPIDDAGVLLIRTQS